MSRVETAPVAAQNAPSAPCYFFDKLSAELRNTIYEFAFDMTNDQKIDEDGRFELKHAKPPTKDLLLICHQVNNEASGIYRTSYHRFWTESKFSINLYYDINTTTLTGFTSIDLSPFSDLDLSHVSHLRITEAQTSTLPYVHQKMWVQDLVDRCGIWSYQFRHDIGSSRITYQAAMTCLIPSEGIFWIPVSNLNDVQQWRRRDDYQYSVREQIVDLIEGEGVESHRKSYTRIEQDLGPR